MNILYKLGAPRERQLLVRSDNSFCCSWFVVVVVGCCGCCGCCGCWLLVVGCCLVVGYWLLVVVDCCCWPHCIVQQITLEPKHIEHPPTWHHGPPNYPHEKYSLPEIAGLIEGY